MHGYLLKIKSKLLFILISIFYIIGTYIYFELINQIDQKLTVNGIYLEFGHANLLLIELFLICLIVTIINIVLILVKRKQINKACH